MYLLNPEISRMIVADRQCELRVEAKAERLARLARSGAKEARAKQLLPHLRAATR